MIHWNGSQRLPSSDKAEPETMMFPTAFLPVTLAILSVPVAAILPNTLAAILESTLAVILANRLAAILPVALASSFGQGQNWPTDRTNGSFNCQSRI